MQQQQSVWVCEDGMLWELCFSLDEINCRERSLETSLGCRGKVASGKQAPAGFKGRHWCHGRRSYLTARWLATGDRIDSMCLRSCSEGALPARSTASFSFLFALGESRSSDLLPSLISVVDRRVAPVERAWFNTPWMATLPRHAIPCAHIHPHPPQIIESSKVRGRSWWEGGPALGAWKERHKPGEAVDGIADILLLQL